MVVKFVSLCGFDCILCSNDEDGRMVRVFACEGGDAGSSPSVPILSFFSLFSISLCFKCFSFSI